MPPSSSALGQTAVSGNLTPSSVPLGVFGGSLCAVDLVVLVKHSGNGLASTPGCHAFGSRYQKSFINMSTATIRFVTL